MSARLQTIGNPAMSASNTASAPLDYKLRVLGALIFCFLSGVLFGAVIFGVQ
jgi:hypothetical protein